MLPASNKGAGMNIGFPDVCLTPAPPGPPIPVPYPNMAMNAMAVPFSVTVKTSGVNALNLGSEIPLTQGDQGGVASPIMGPGRYVIGNLVVNVEALPAANLGLPSDGNNMNDAAGVAAVPSVVNVFFTQAGAAPEGNVDVRAMRAISQSLAAAPEAERVLPGGVVLLSIPVFSTSVPAHVYSALARVGLPRVSALILDLTGCPGGELVSALELAGDFLDEGAVLVTATDADGDETVHRARGARPYRFPLFLLVDRRTASAAEVFAGAMKAHRRATLIGEPTYGKGSAQRLVLGARYATVAQLTLPDGVCIEGRGVLPDIEAAPSAALSAALAASAAVPTPAQ
jgi:carboxyl-terminal processing protease